MANSTKVDGMRYPSIDKLLERIDSKYKLAYAAAKRAKIIEQEHYTSVDRPHCVKPVGQALEEIIQGDTTIKFKDELGVETEITDNLSEKND